MRQILIIADDLSGAADSGIACTHAGLSAAVVLGSTAPEMDVDVLSVDGDTRCMNPQSAAEEIDKLMLQFENPRQIIFKKVDSTLRGNIGAELQAMLRAQRSFDSERKHSVILLAPAFPAQGRTTLQGRQILHGKFLEGTEIWKREGREDRAHIPEILEASGLRTGCIGLDVVRSDRHHLRDALFASAAESDVLVCDAESDDDLRTLAEAGSVLGRSTIWAGSAGLAYHLPKAAGITPCRADGISQEFATGPTLFVIGSMSGVSRGQASLLTNSSDTVTITIPATALRAKNENSKWLEYELGLSRAIESERDVVLLIGPEEKGPDRETCDARQGSTTGMERRRLSSALAEMIRPHATKFGALVATGGETAVAVLRAWGVAALRLIRELEPGVPFSVTENWRRPIAVLTKAGDFGTPQTLLHCQKFLRDLDRSAIKSLYHGKEV